MTYPTGPLRMLVLGLFVVTGVFLVLWTWSALGHRAPSGQALRYFDRQFLERASERATWYYLALALRNAFVFGTAFVLVRSGFIVGATENLLTRAGASTHSGVTRAFIGGAVASFLWLLAVSVASLPFQYYTGYYLERLYGLARMTAGQWFIDYGKSFLLTALVTVLSGGVLTLFIAVQPRAWPYLAGAGVLVLSLMLSYLYPVLVAPMFYRFRPLEDPDLLRDVQELARKAGIEVSQVLVMEASKKTTRLNAYFAGLGKTKQVVLYDTLLSEASREQARLVLAHEMSHYKHNHVLKSVILSSAGALLAFMLFAWAFARSFPGPSVRGTPGTTAPPCPVTILVMLLLFLSLVEFVTTPAGNCISRQFEIQADLDSLAWTGDVQAFLDSQVKLARGNLSDVDPPAFIRWFAWTHPTTLERLELALRDSAFDGGD
ncbi:MAG: M48 family metallopeptidase [Firmicutes bacterium]|nr:M48 family metallopeptidase [Candidatus Fermentithermobacillaceae bacterium]